MTDLKKRDIPLFLKENNLLYIVSEGKEIELHIKQCFPWSNPREFLSLRDCDDNEVCLIEDLNELDSETRGLLEEYLRSMGFVLEVTSVLEIKEDVELRQYKVDTAQGLRIFQTKLEDWPEILNDGSIVIEDLSGDLFRVKSFKELDSKSRQILGTYVS